jgi:hypothetical protein
MAINHTVAWKIQRLSVVMADVETESHDGMG